MRRRIASIQAKVRGPGPIFRQGAAQQQSSSEADSQRCHRDGGCTFRTFPAAELQNRGGGSARRQADADAHQVRPPNTHHTSGATANSRAPTSEAKRPANIVARRPIWSEILPNPTN